MRISDWSSDVCSSDLYAARQSPVVQEALERIAALYAVEKAIRGRPPDERRQVRQKRSRPAAEDLFAWREITLPKLSGRSDSRSEERRVGRECGSTCRSRGAPYP